MSAIGDLTDLLAPGPSGVSLLVGVVTAVNSSDNTVNVRIGGNTGDSDEPDNLTSVPRLASYTPATGHTVLVLDDGEEQVVIGQIA